MLSTKMTESPAQAHSQFNSGLSFQHEAQSIIIIEAL